MKIYETEFDLPVTHGHQNLISYFASAVSERLQPDEIAVRFLVSATGDEYYHCELGILNGAAGTVGSLPESIFRIAHRKTEHTGNFNAAMVVPTGIGAELGGHAGDATPAVKMFASFCDKVITHPNVVNASDINEMPDNALYVEGSVLSRFLLGTVGLQPVRANRVLTIIDAHRDTTFSSAAINSVSAARSAFGLNCPAVVMVDPPIVLRAEYSSTGRARGTVEELDGLFAALQKYSDSFDAVAISSVIRVPHSYHMDYFLCEGHMVNPWGGVEAMLTHALSLMLNVPTAHSPMLESQEIANMDPGIVEPRTAAEAVSLTYLHCILKGLAKSPKIVTDRMAMRESGVLTVSDVSCLVIPDGCIGLPTLAALEQGIPLIAVRENKNLMKNDLRVLPWSAGQLLYADNYWEAAGIAASLKAGISPMSVRRPLSYTHADMVCANKKKEVNTTVERVVASSRSPDNSK